MKNANEAIRLSPTVGEYLICRAEILFEAEDFQKSIADISQAITLGAVNSRAFRQRGVSRFYMGDFSGAADDLSKASGMADSESQVYIDLWLALANLRLGKPVADVIVRGSVLEARGDWPRPALAALAQHIVPGEVLKILDAKIGDERVMALAEGYFYLRQFYLVNGNATRVKEFFEKAVQQQVIIYTEHRAALFELKRLNEAH
jgi:lipoprotein NlpI